MNEKKLGLGNVVSISVGLVVATSCLVSLGNGAGTLGVTFILAMAIAMLLNMTTVASLSELNALMPNTTGGLAQYTLAALGPFPTLISMVGGYIICNTMSCGVEASIFSFSLADVVGGHIPSFVYTHYDGDHSVGESSRRGYVCEDPGYCCISAGRFPGCDGIYRNDRNGYRRKSTAALCAQCRF